jgi:hypothetical protein
MTRARPTTRVSAGQQGADEAVASGTGLREWLAAMPAAPLHLARRLPGSGICSRWGAPRRQ